MEQQRFYRLGQGIYRFRWLIITLWLLITLACIPFLPYIMTPFKTTGFVDEKSSSALIEQKMNKKLGYSNENKFLVLYGSQHLLATDSVYNQKIKKSLSGLKYFPIKHEIIFPKNNKNQQSSNDKHAAYAAVIIKSKTPIDGLMLEKFKSSIKKPPDMSMTLGGEPLFVETMNKQTQTDLYKADYIATPVTLITLIIVFGSLTAALIPVLLGGISALIILTLLYFFGNAFTLSIFTLNIALLLGLCLTLDYSLFIISRFRNELQRNLPIKQAIAITQSTAGKAIFFSGLAVFSSLSALLLFPINILFSVAIGGLVSVLVAAFIAIILLPAILSVLNHRIDYLSIHYFRKKQTNRASAWHYLSEKVVNNPLKFFFAILFFLLLLGYPVTSAKLGISDYRVFPEHSKNREFFDTYDKKFNVNALNPIIIVVESPHQSMLSQKNIYHLYSFAHKLKKNAWVDEVNSIVTTDKKLSKSQYYNLYHIHRNNKEIKTLLNTTTKDGLTTIDVISKYPMHSKKTNTLITQIHNMKIHHGMHFNLTGTPVKNADVIKRITETLSYALIWIMAFTYIILLILLRSVFLPIKAIIMNLISLCACYGALVLVFQEGYLSNLLNFDPQGMLDVSLLVIIFCALFGFSMDYEVFLLSRIKEFYDQTGDNNSSIIFGIEKSAGIITSAAIIVIFICCSFLVADVLIVKAFGLGIAVAIFVDAFLVRSILVPATMALFKRWNWYLPKWLDKILPR